MLNRFILSARYMMLCADQLFKSDQSYLMHTMPAPPLPPTLPPQVHPVHLWLLGGCAHTCQGKLKWLLWCTDSICLRYMYSLHDALMTFPCDVALCQTHAVWHG